MTALAPPCPHSDEQCSKQIRPHEGKQAYCCDGECTNTHIGAHKR